MIKRAALLFACAFALSCGGETSDRTQVMVVIDAEPAVRALTKDIDLEVRSGSGPVDEWDVRARRSLTPGNAIDWPLEAALIPQSDDADRVYLLIATALDEDGEPVSEVRAISGYVRGKTLSLLLLFEDSCLERSDMCDDEQTCRDGECVDAHVEPRDLPAFQRDSEGRAVLEPFWDDAGIDTDGGDDGGAGSGGSGGSGGASGAGGSGGTAGGGDAAAVDCDRDADCNDGNPCNGQETCKQHSCRAGTPFTCDDTGEFCVANVCVNDGGRPRCEEQNVHEDETCADNELSSDAESSCSVDYRCVEGACLSQSSQHCDPGQCERRAGCDADGCVLLPLSDVTGCDDGDPCTDNDVCNGTDNVCAGVAKDCADSTDCTVDSCNAAGECVHTADDGLCSGPCKSGTCDAVMGCLNVTLTQDFETCSDGSSATGPDLCYRGECLGGRERAPTASCEVAGCGCSGFGAVRDLEYVGNQYVGLVEANQLAGGSCTAGTVSIVYDVQRSEMTPFTTDTANGAISEGSTDISSTYVSSNNSIGYLNTTDDSVQWLNTSIEAALTSQVPSIINYRGIARHSTGSFAATRTNHVWVWGAQQGTSAALVARCSWCTSILGGSGCDGSITCTSAGFSSSTIASVMPYVSSSVTASYGGGIQLMNYASTPRRRIYEDGTGKDLVYNTIEVDDSDGAWSGTLRLAGAGQVLAFGSGSSANARLCTDASYSGDTTCTAVTITANPRSFTRAAVGFSNTSVFLLGTNGAGQYLYLLPAGTDPATTGNWHEITLANSGTTVANAVAAGPDSFMVLGKTGNVPYVWYWGP